MYQFSACATKQYIEITVIIWSFQTEEQVLKLNKSKITGENTFHRDNFEIEGNQESSKDKENLFWIFFQICDLCFKCQTVKYVYLRFSGILWFSQFLRLFLWVLEARSKLNIFHTKF